MARLVRRGWFPPLPETGNRRSMVHVDDVLSALQLVAHDARANGRTYIIVGPEAPSGRRLLDEIRRIAGMRELRWSVPFPILRVAAGMGDRLGQVLGRRIPFDSEVLSRLLGSACYSGGRIHTELGWQPRVSLQDGLREMMGCD